MDYEKTVQHYGLTPEEVYDDGSRCASCAYAVPLYLRNDLMAHLCCVYNEGANPPYVDEVSPKTLGCANFEWAEDEG